jgi:hypothetical protein
LDKALPLDRRSTQFVIDGAAVIFCIDVVSDFNALHYGKFNHEVQLYAFDVIATGRRRLALAALVDAQGEPRKAIASATGRHLHGRLRARQVSTLCSGFELSASYVVPDANILPMDVHLEKMRAVSEVQPGYRRSRHGAVNVAYVIPAKRRRRTSLYSSALAFNKFASTCLTCMLF